MYGHTVFFSLPFPFKVVISPKLWLTLTNPNPHFAVPVWKKWPINRNIYFLSMPFLFFIFMCLHCVQFIPSEITHCTHTFQLLLLCFVKTFLSWALCDSINVSAISLIALCNWTFSQWVVTVISLTLFFSITEEMEHRTSFHQLSVITQLLQRIFCHYAAFNKLLELKSLNIWT